MSHPDHFALFALPARFALDETALEQAYKGVQSKVHPDRFAAGSAAERRVAMQWAARANEAYRTLKRPHARAAYLCERAGVAIEAGSNTAMPADFLMQQMEWREALDEARAPADAERLAQLAELIDEQRGRLMADLESAIDVRADFVAAADLVRRLMFIDKFREELREAAQDLPHRASA
jgi:molecular chaperone HscB